MLSLSPIVLATFLNALLSSKAKSSANARWFNFLSDTVADEEEVRRVALGFYPACPLCVLSNKSLLILA